MLDTEAVWTSASCRNCYNSLNGYVLCACTELYFYPTLQLSAQEGEIACSRSPRSWPQSSFVKIIFKNKNCTYLRYTTWWFDIHTHSEMVTAVKLINIDISSHRYHFFLFYFCCGENTWNHSSSKLPVFI